MYRVVKCPNCAFFQVTGASKALKCQRCGKSKVITYLKVFFQSPDNLKCAKVLAKLKEEEARQKGKYSEEFDSVI